MRELPQRHRALLEGRRIVVASADRVLISGLVHSLDGVGSLVGATSTEAEALACLSSTAADLLPNADSTSIAEHHSRCGSGELRRALQS